MSRIATNSQRRIAAIAFAVLLTAGTAMAHEGATGVVAQRMDLMKQMGQHMKALGAMQAKGRSINHQLGMGKTGMPDGVQHLKRLLFFSRIKTKEKNILIKIQMLKIATV